MTGITRAQRVRLGIFLALGLTILGVAFVYLAGRALVEQRDEYLIRFPDKDISLAGMEVGSEVKYSGIRIGRVEKIRVSEGDVSTLEVVISVPVDTLIAEDSVAQVASAGITGTKYVELSRGSTQARIRKPGETIPSGPSLMDELSAKAVGIASQLETVLKNLQTLTAPDSSIQGMLKSSQGLIDDNRENITKIITDSQKVTADLAAFSEKGVGVAEKADTLLATFNQAGQRVNTTLGPNGTLIKSLEQTESLLQRVNFLVLRSENDIDVSLRNLREATANLADFSMAIRDNPTLLLNNPGTKGSPEEP